MDRGIKMELSEEEKKAIEDLKKLKMGIEYLNLIARVKDEVDIKAIDIILNLINKLKNNLYEEQEQNEYLKDKVDKQQKRIEKLKFSNHMVGKWNEYLDKDCISKNRIKEIIKKYIDIEEALNYTNQEIYGEDLKNMILELLGEN